MWKKVLALVVLLFLGFAIAVLLRPDGYTVEREITIDASPEVVFSLLDNFPAWRTWSPWDDRDPDAEVEIGGPPRGVGAWYTWSGNREVGKGKMTIVESKPPERIVWRLEFIEPFEDESDTWIRLEPTDEGTRVVWGMAAGLDLFGRAISLFVDFPEMIGADFEAGLDRLAERAHAAKAAQADTPSDTDAPPTDTAE